MGGKSLEFPTILFSAGKSVLAAVSRRGMQGPGGRRAGEGAHSNMQSPAAP